MACAGGSGAHDEGRSGRWNQETDLGRHSAEISRLQINPMIGRMRLPDCTVENAGRDGFRGRKQTKVAT